MCPYWFLPVLLVLLAFFLCPTPGCRAYRDPDVRHAKTRMSDMSRSGCYAMPFHISVFSFSLPLFLFARMRIYYNVSLLPDFPSSLKKYVLQHICQSAFYKNVQEKREKIPWYIWRVYYKVLLLHPLSRTGAAMFWHSDRNGVGTLTYFFCLGLVSFWNSPLKKQNEKKLPKTFGRYKINGRVLALEVSPKTGVLQREQPISVGTTACCNRLMNLTVSATQFADLFAFELLFVDGVLHSQLISSPPRYTTNLCLFQTDVYLKSPNLIFNLSILIVKF